MVPTGVSQDTGPQVTGTEEHPLAGSHAAGAAATEWVAGRVAVEIVVVNVVVNVVAVGAHTP